MNEDITKAYSEIYEILKFFDEKYIRKIPQYFMELLEKEKDDTHKIEINPNIPLEEQNLLSDTINLLAIIKLDYWCENEEERQELLDILNKNEEEYQQQLNEKYNPDDIFKNKKNEEPKELQNIKQKNVIQKLFEKIRNMFKKV